MAGYSYYSGANVTISSNGKNILECAGISFNVSNSAQPAYGYASQMYDMVLPGRKLIQGSFVINYRHANYLVDYLSDLVKASVQTEDSVEDLINRNNLFDITISYGGSSNARDLVLKNCYIISRGQTIQISEQVILEEYSFIGRNLETLVSSITPTISTPPKQTKVKAKPAEKEPQQGDPKKQVVKAVKALTENDVKPNLQGNSEALYQNTSNEGEVNKTIKKIAKNETVTKEEATEVVKEVAPMVPNAELNTDGIEINEDNATQSDLTFRLNYFEYGKPGNPTRQDFSWNDWSQDSITVSNAYEINSPYYGGTKEPEILLDKYNEFLQGSYDPLEKEDDRYSDKIETFWKELYIGEKHFEVLNYLINFTSDRDDSPAAQPNDWVVCKPREIQGDDFEDFIGLVPFVDATNGNTFNTVDFKDSDLNDNFSNTGKYLELNYSADGKHIFDFKMKLKRFIEKTEKVSMDFKKLFVKMFYEHRSTWEGREDINQLEQNINNDFVQYAIRYDNIYGTGFDENQGEQNRNNELEAGIADLLNVDISESWNLPADNQNRYLQNHLLEVLAYLQWLYFNENYKDFLLEGFEDQDFDEAGDFYNGEDDSIIDHLKNLPDEAPIHFQMGYNLHLKNNNVTNNVILNTKSDWFED